MKILRFENHNDWLLARRERITGTGVKDISLKRDKSFKIGYYQLIADKLSSPPDYEDPKKRGIRLEPEAIDRFEAETGNVVNKELAIWTRDDNDRISISPDGWIGSEAEGIREAVEVKCLKSAKHVEALLTQEIPKEYMDQALQYFIVNDELETLHFCFYDPLMKVHDFHIIELKRDTYLVGIEEYLTHERFILASVDEAVEKLSEF